MPNGLVLLLLTKFLGHINLEQIARVEHFTCAEHLVNSGEHHSGDGDDGAFLAATLGYPLVLDTVVSGALGFDSSVGSLNKGRFEIDTRARDTDGFLLSCGLIVAGR